MKRTLVFLMPVVFLFSCGSEGETDDTTASEENSDFFANDGPEVTASRELKDKLGQIYGDFMEIAHKEIEESVCGPGASFDYKPKGEELNVWLMTNNMLANFDKEKPGQFGYEIPDSSISSGTPMGDFWWLNFDTICGINWDVYMDFPDLTDIPKMYKDETGERDYTAMDDPQAVHKALSDGLLGVVAIVDYLSPVDSAGEIVGGYVMGYVLFADINTGKMSCLSPILAQNSEELMETVLMEESLDAQETFESELRVETFNQISEAVKNLTGFEGNVFVNEQDRMNAYR